MIRVLRFAASVLDPRAYLHGLRLLHFYSYAHVRQVGRLTRGADVSFAPNVSFRNAERIGSVRERTSANTRRSGQAIPADASSSVRRPCSHRG